MANYQRIHEIAMPEEQAKAHILRVYGPAGEDVVAAETLYYVPGDMALALAKSLVFGLDFDDFVYDRGTDLFFVCVSSHRKLLSALYRCRPGHVHDDDPDWQQDEYIAKDYGFFKSKAGASIYTAVGVKLPYTMKLLEWRQIEIEPWEDPCQ